MVSVLRLRTDEHLELPGEVLDCSIGFIEVGLAALRTQHNLFVLLWDGLQFFDGQLHRPARRPEFVHPPLA